MRKWELVNFCENDKYAIKSYCAIHKVNEELNLGDITKVDEFRIKDFNVICGGSPCQDFSIAGKQKGAMYKCKTCGFTYNPLQVHWSKRHMCPKCNSKKIKGTRSSMVVRFLDIVRVNEPSFGMFENVKNIVGKQFKETFNMFIEELREYGYNVYYKVLNSKDYGVPQNRERVYVIFIKKELDNGKFKCPKKFDNGIRLKDVLEDEVDGKYYISDDKVQKFLENLKSENIREDSTLKLDGNNYNQRCVVHTPDDFCRTIIGSGDSGGYHGSNEPKVIVNLQSENAVKQVGNISDCNGSWKNPQVGRIYDSDGCSPTLNICGGGSHEPKIVCGIDKGVNDTKQIEYANCITVKEDRGISNRKSEVTAVFEVKPINTESEGICRTIKAQYYKTSLANYKRTGDMGATGVTNGIAIRKLTPKECFRLMGFPDSAYEAASKTVSNSQLYKQSGNSIVVDVLYYILIELYKAMPYLFNDIKLLSLFSGIGAFECALNRLYESINTGNFIKP